MDRSSSMKIVLRGDDQDMLLLCFLDLAAL